MISNRLSSNLKIFKEEYKKYIWVTALTTGIFFFLKIVMPLLDYSKYLKYKNYGVKNLSSQLQYLNDYLTLNYDFIKIIIIGLAIFVGCLVFSYLHNKNKVDFYHSLPISRNSLFFIKYFLGIIIVIPVMIIMHFILYGIYGIVLKDNLVSFKEVLKPLIFDTLFFIVIYSVTVFANILSGNTVISVILSGILLNINLIISTILILITKILSNRIINLDYTMDYAIKYSPIPAYVMISNNFYKNIFTNTEFSYSRLNIFIIYTIISLILIVINLLLFKVRKSENSNVCIAFKYAKTILKYIGVCIGAIYLGVMFLSISSLTGAFYLGVIFGAIILHCIVEIIYEFDFKAIFKNWYSIIGCIIICFAIGISLQFDLFKRIEYLPEVDKIESVEKFAFYGTVSNIKDKEFIENINKLHNIFIEDYKNKGIKGKENYSHSRITYGLKNNSILSRSIFVDTSNEEVKNLIKNIVNNEEYMKQANRMLYVDIPYNNLEIMILDNSNNTKFLSNITKADKREFIEMLKKDIEKNGIYVEDEKILFEVRLSLDDYLEKYNLNKSYLDISITDKYTNTLNYLANLGIKPKNFTLDEVEKVLLDTSQDTLEITDKDDIEKILSNYTLDRIFSNYKFNDYGYLTVFIKNKPYNREESVGIYISIELYEELKEKYLNKK